MKKHRVIMACVTALGLCAAGLTASIAAEIIFIEGSVQVQSSGAAEWKTAEKGMTVEIGDSIRTARHSRADIALDAEKLNTIRIEQKTLVVLNSESAESIDRCDLSRGRVYANMEGLKAGLGFEVTTPSAVAGVRGSSYMVYVEKDQDEISAYEDTVFLKTYDPNKQLLSETMLPQGFKTFIERFQMPGVFSQIANREYMRFDVLRETLVAHSEGREPELEREQQAPQQEQPAQEQTEQIQEQGAVNEEITETQESTQERDTEQTIEERQEQESEPPPEQCF